MSENYQVDISTYQMVLNRLPFLADNATNKDLVGSFIYEVMWELNKCFGKEESDIGLDEHYNIIQRSIVAALVAVYIITLRLLSNTAGTASGSTDSSITIPTGSKYITKSKAGSVETEWKMFSLKENAGFFTNGNDMLAAYKTEATRKALSIGCIIDMTDEVAVAAWMDMQILPQPFVVVSEGCGGFRTNVPEQA